MGLSAGPAEPADAVGAAAISAAAPPSAAITPQRRGDFLATTLGLPALVHLTE
jgi:hypothetical protein